MMPLLLAPATHGMAPKKNNQVFGTSESRLLKKSFWVPDAARFGRHNQVLVAMKAALRGAGRLRGRPCVRIGAHQRVFVLDRGAEILEGAGMLGETRATPLPRGWRVPAEHFP
jgi:hypothetical protein